MHVPAVKMNGHARCRCVESDFGTARVLSMLATRDNGPRLWVSHVLVVCTGAAAQINRGCLEQGECTLRESVDQVVVFSCTLL